MREMTARTRGMTGNGTDSAAMSGTSVVAGTSAVSSGIVGSSVGSVDDQKRVATPEYAKEQGCDMIVVGRSITKAENPYETYRMIEEAMN